MFQRDYILRMIEQFTKALAKILFNKSLNNYEAALEELHNNYKGVFGIDKELIAVSSAEEIVALLKLKNIADPKVDIMLAEYLSEEADIQNIVSNGTCDKSSLDQKALELFFEAVLVHKEFQLPEYYSKINDLVEATKSFARQVELSKKIIRYFELTNDYSKAEDILFGLTVSFPAVAGAEGEAFYKRLECKTDEELLKGNFTRDEIHQGLAEFRKLMADPRAENKLK